MPAAIQSGSRIVDIDSVERCGEAVGIAFAPHLAVGDDVDAGLLLRLDGHESGVVLRLLKKIRGNSPQFSRPNARWKSAGESGTVDEPFRLRVATDYRCGKQHHDS